MTTLCSCLLMLAVAACGDDGGNNNGDDTCGDGQKTGAEQCDDGNTMNGDGCSSTCRNESSGPVCGDGVMSGNEECDDSNTMDGDGCSATCMDEEKPETCGNGALDANEDCDDANTIANDGCTACNVDNGWTCNDAAPSVCTMVLPPDGSCTMPFTVTLAANADGDLEGHAMGDTTGGMDHVPTADCNGDDLGGGNDHVYTFTLAAAADVLITGPDPAAFDMAIRLSREACSVPMQVADDVGSDGCSDDDPEGLFYVNLPAGTYYLTVDGYDNTEAGAYDVTITAFATSTCGDGLLDIGEECDDDNTTGTDGCDMRCDVETGYVCDTDVEPSVCELACGNGTFESDLEECEYIVGENDDVCSATCTLLSDVTEVEPNDTTPQAIGAGNHRRVRGTLPANDVDLYTFTLTAPSIVEIETYNASDTDDTNYTGRGGIANIDCFRDLDTTLGLFPDGADYTMDAMALAVDDDDGDLACSYVGFADFAGDITQGILEPGTYVIRVKEFSEPAGVYILDVYITPAEAPQAGDLVINEYMANDGVLDTNCDNAGTTTQNTDDEFVELVNATEDVFIDLTGVTIADGTATRHTFAAGATGRMGLLPGESVVVWAGGAPACAGVDNFFTASGGSLGLNNSGAESITVAAAGAGGAMLATVAFTATTQGVSSNLDPDVTGTSYALHNAITGHVGDFSPGKRTDATAFPLFP
ncbi:MAG: DUF4215 domain-containing protein [Kofleriaceae bacterium]